MAKPSYLPLDTYRNAMRAAFDDRAERDIWKLSTDSQWDADIGSLADLAKPAPLEMQAMPEADPLPIVVSERPDAMQIREQQQSRSTAMPTIPQADGMVVHHIDGRQQQQPSMRPGEQMGNVEMATGPATAAATGPAPERAGEYRAYARAVAQQYGVDPDIFERQINQESGFRPWGDDGKPLGSSAGAQGIAQFMPATAAGYGVDVNDPYSSLEGAARHMRDLLKANNGNYRYALAAYNAGQGAVNQYGDGVFEADFAHGQTRDYVNIILGPQSSAPTMQRVSLTATPPFPSGASVAAPPPAAAGASPPPAAAPPAPWANETAQGGLMMKAEDEPLMGPGDGGYAPQVPISTPFDPDQGPREATPGSVGSQPLPQTPNPMTYGPIQQGDVAEGPPTLGDVTYQNGGEPTANGPWTEMPVRPLEAQQPANEQASASPGSITDHLGNVLLPVLDSAGQIVSYVQQQARQLGRQIAPRGNPVANVAQGLTPGGQTYGQAVAPIMNPRRETNVAPEAFIRDAMDVGQNAPKVPAAIDQKITEIANEARSQFQQAGQAYDEGRMGEAVLNGVMGALNVVGSPWTVAAEGIDTVLPTMEANSALSMGDAITNADLIRDARMIAQAVAKLVRAGVRVTPEIVAALRSGAAVEDFLNGAAGAIDRGIEAVAPVARRAGELASDVGAGIGRGVRSVAEEAAYQATFGPRSMAQNIVPPGVADEMGATFPVRVPTDPKAIRAIEAIGGTVDPQRGVTINVTRAQGPQAAGMPATRGGVFYEAVPEGGRSNFVRGSDDPTGVGGSQVIPATPTRFRSPLIVSDAPGGSNGFEESMRQMGVENPVHGGPVYSYINDAIRQARAAGPEGSEARADALREVVRRFGGDEDLIEPLLRVRGADASESEWAIRENILAAHARRNGYDGVVTVQPRTPLAVAIQSHPTVVAAKAQADQAAKAFDEAEAAYLSNSNMETFEAYQKADAAQFQANQALATARREVEASFPSHQITELMDVREGANPTPSPTRNPALVEAEQALATAEDEFNRAQAAAKKIWQSGKRPTHEQNIWLAEQYEYVDTLRRNVNELNRSRPTVGDPGFSVRPDIQRPPGAQWAGMPFDPASAAMGGAAGAASEDEEGDSGDPLRTAGGMAVAGILGNISPRAAARWRQATQRASMQAAAARAAGKAPPATAGDWLRSIGYSGMIGPSTGIVNAVGNGMELLYHLPKDIVRSAVRGAPREAYEEAKGLLTGLTRAGGEMLDALAGAHPGGGVETARLSQRVQNPFGQMAANLIEAPMRVFSEVPDAFYRSIATSMGESRMAAQIASNEGLTGAAWSQRVNQLLSDVATHRAGGQASPQVVSIIKDGVELAERLTLRGDVGPRGEAVKKAFDALPFGLGNVVMPFFNTPYQMLQRGLERSPAGLRMGTQPAKFDKYYDAILGTSVALGAAGLAMGGMVTGSGPDDPEKKAMLRSQGWQANSTLVGGVWMPNNAFGVFGPMLDTAGEIGDGVRYQKKDDPNLGEALVKRTLRVVKNQVYLRGLSDLIKATEDPGSFGASYAANLGSRLIPLGATARTVGNATDPLERQVDRSADVGFLEASRQRVARGLPGQGLPIIGGREQLDPAQDVLGRPMENERTGAAALGPKTRTPKPDATVQAFTDAGVDIGFPPDKITIDGIPLELTPAEQRRWQRERGAILEKYAGNFTEKPWWNKPAARETAMKELLRDANVAANGKVQQFIGADSLRRRLREAAQKKAS